MVKYLKHVLDQDALRVIQLEGYDVSYRTRINHMIQSLIDVKFFETVFYSYRQGHILEVQPMSLSNNYSVEYKTTHYYEEDEEVRELYGYRNVNIGEFIDNIFITPGEAELELIDATNKQIDILQEALDLHFNIKNAALERIGVNTKSSY